MAASVAREPQDVPLPPSPIPPNSKSTKSSVKKGKGKELSATQKRRMGKAVNSTSSSPTSDSTWDWVSLTESCPSKAPPVFTKDGSYFFSLVGASVKIFTSSTGQLISTLSAPQLEDSSSDVLTSVILNPHNVFQIITGSLNGLIRVWDYLDATLLKTLDLGQPIHHISAHAKHEDYVFITASRRSKHKGQNTADDNAVVLRVSLKATDVSAHSVIQKSSEITPIGKTRFPTGLSLSPSGGWLVVTAGHKVYVSALSSLKSGFTKYVSSDRLSCLAFHPGEEYFATGDVKGNIRLWYCLNETVSTKVAGLEKKTQTASFHWHAHAVSSLAFTSNGAYLLSGGEESVLVLWQLHTGKKEFVPRVGAPIQTISVFKGSDGGEEYLLGLTDATFVFVSAATLKISRSYSRIKLSPSSHNVPSSSRAAPLAVHSLSSTLILPSSHPSSIQIYSPSSAKVLSELEVSPSNRVSRRDEKPLEPSRVERTEMSPNGEWLASIDARSGDEDFQGEVCLKIWRWDKKTSTWTLNTRIDRPHGVHFLTDISFSPYLKGTREFYLVTTGQDGTIKSWRLRSTQGSRGVIEDYWVPRSSFGFRSEIPSHTSWSPDGSLLAITLGTSVAVYDPMTNIHRATLTSPECRNTKAAHFVGRGRYVAVIGLHDLVLWDIVTHTVRWCFKSTHSIDALVPHPENDSFTLFSSEEESRITRVHKFSTSSSSPSKIVSLPFSLRSITWYSQLQTPAFSLVGISHDWRVVLVGDEVRVPEDEGTSARGIKSTSSQQQRRTLFQDIFGKSIFNENSSKLSSGAAIPRVRHSELDISSIFDVPAYLTPPMDTLFEPLITNLLRRDTEDADPTPVPEGPYEDVEMIDVTVEAFRRGSGSKQRVDQQEDMSEFIGLFKAQSLKCTTSRPPKINGTSRHTTSNTRTPSKSKSQTTLSTAPQVDGLHQPLNISTPIVNGKKRKKASD